MPQGVSHGYFYRFEISDIVFYKLYFLISYYVLLYYTKHNRVQKVEKYDYYRFDYLEKKKKKKISKYDQRG